MGNANSGPPRVHSGPKYRLAALPLVAAKMAAMVPVRREQAYGRIAWSGRVDAHADYWIKLDRPKRIGLLRLAYDFQHLTEPTGLQEYFIRMVAADLPGGGLRWLFLCPLTRKRSPRLFLPNGAGAFGCMTAYRLVSDIANMGKLDRLHHRLRRLWAEMGFEYPGSIAEPPPKPHGMRWKKYHRLVAGIEKAQMAIWLRPPSPKIMPGQYDQGLL